jgi:hypothetical protein
MAIYIRSKNKLGVLLKIVGINKTRNMMGVLKTTQNWTIKNTRSLHPFQHTTTTAVSTASTVQRLPLLHFNVLIIIIMSSATSHSLPSPFAMDPVRTSVRSLSTEHIQLLHGPHHLSTALIDYLLHHGLKDKLHQNLLIGTSNSTALFDVMNQKTIGSAPTNNANSKTVQRARDKYRPYCFNRFQFLTAVCSHNHFFAVDVAFDTTTETIFDHVTIYDSLRFQSPKGNNVENTSIAGQFLLQLHLFLSQYCIFGQDYNNKLHEDPSFILQRALYAGCPQQKNSNDCSLFAFAIVLHLAHGLPVTQDVFTQQHVTGCRLGLASELSSVPVSLLRPEFLSSFYPKLSNNSQLAFSPAQFPTDNPNCSSKTGGRQR